MIRGRRTGMPSGRYHENIGAHDLVSSSPGAGWAVALVDHHSAANAAAAPGIAPAAKQMGRYTAAVNRARVSARMMRVPRRR